ncbi:MAG TPA: IclR family transcriptional regulator C-terminal domain-containing protein [Candidatus Ratteibacteria bacterium]|nr:IclR family transcriptional regulator C-terminal domain-containing protein [Candidatus Ratteibacteria bacterium]
MEKKIKVIEKIMGIFEVLADRGKEGCSVSEIAKKLNLKLTTTHSLVSTLFSLGYLEKNIQTRKYKIGEKLLNIFLPFANRNILLKVSEPVMKALAEEIKESVVLAIFWKGDRYTIATASYDKQLISVNLNQFIYSSCYSQATGRILLSYLDKKVVNEYIKRNGFPKEKWNNIRNYNDLQKELKKIKEKKIEIIERETVVAIAVPIFSPDGKVCASLGVYLPRIRFKGQRKEKIIKEIKKAGEQITLNLRGEK